MDEKEKRAFRAAAAFLANFEAARYFRSRRSAGTFDRTVVGERATKGGRVSHDRRDRGSLLSEVCVKCCSALRTKQKRALSACDIISDRGLREKIVVSAELEVVWEA